MSKKIALVTGASASIGKATAIQLLNDGYTVYGAARRVENMKDIEEKGVKFFVLDLANEKSIKKCIDSIVQKEGTIDILINNAGFGSSGTIEESPMSVVRA